MSSEYYSCCPFNVSETLVLMASSILDSRRTRLLYSLYGSIVAHFVAFLVFDKSCLVGTLGTLTFHSECIFNLLTHCLLCFFACFFMKCDTNSGKDAYLSVTIKR